MSEVSVKIAVNVSAELLWDLVGRFHNFGQWHPMVKRSEISGRGRGALRKLRLIDGGMLVERLEYVSDTDRFYVYSVIDGSLPVSHCVAQIRVTESPRGTSVMEWSSQFIPRQSTETGALDVVRSIYRQGLENVKRIFESPPAPVSYRLSRRR